MSDDADDASVVTELNRHYWTSLAAEGQLSFQRCRRDGHSWLPPRSECPRCWQSDWEWETACGRATVLSWVTYHYAATPALAERVPYNVAIVELAEGPRLVTRLLEPTDGVRVGAPVQLAPTEQGELTLPTFRIAQV